MTTNNTQPKTYGEAIQQKVAQMHQIRDYWLKNEPKNAKQADEMAQHDARMEIYVAERAIEQFQKDIAQPPKTASETMAMLKRCRQCNKAIPDGIGATCEGCK